MLNATESGLIEINTLGCPPPYQVIGLNKNKMMEG